MKVSHLRDLSGPLPYISLRGMKTKAARRDVLIHPDALPIILRRAKGKTASCMNSRRPMRTPRWIGDSRSPRSSGE